MILPSWPAISASFSTPGQLRADLFGGLTAAVVALPLALAFGVASGAGPAAGLYGAIAVGFFAAAFGGTGSQVSGPTGPMTVVMAAVVASHANSLPEAFTIVMLGGLIQFAFGLLGIGRYVEYTPYSVISGFMTGIGVIIIILQLQPFLGLPASPGGVGSALESLMHLEPSRIDPASTVLAAFSLAALVFWPARLRARVPAPLAVLVVGTLAATVLVPGGAVIGEIPSGLPSFVAPELALGELPTLVQSAFILALLGSIDTLLTSLVADSVTRSRHDADKELAGQGIGNLVAGLIGALPGAGATMRTLVNVRAGGRTPVSGMVHAIALLAFALGLGPLVSRVPLAVLAAILIKVGWDIIDWGYLIRLRRAPREKFVIMLVTLTLTVLVDLITAVGVGIILASFVTARQMATEQLKGLRRSASVEELDHLNDEERELLRQAEGRILVTILSGTFSYASARELARSAIGPAAAQRVAIYDFSNAGYIDTSAAMAIDEMISLSRANGQLVIVSALPGAAMRTLDGLGVLDEVPVDLRFADRRAAIEAALAFCRRA